MKTRPANGTCAIVVTYHPADSVFEHLSILRSQVPGLVVVDNGSTPDVLERMRSESKRIGFYLIENGENRGVAAALNTGVRWAIENEYEWVALFDQDSSVPECYFDAMFRTIASSTMLDKIGVIAPIYRDPSTGYLDNPFPGNDDTLWAVMTSGSLMPVWIFKRCGWFEEEFFIDQVDDEYCFRIQTMGYKIMVCENAILLHTSGTPQAHRLFGFKLIISRHHSAGRRYYITRNGLVMARRYRRQCPAWSRYTLSYLLLKAPIIILLVESDRFMKLVNIARGTIDAYLGRMGKRVKL
ncbi:MAG: glycosyltransferase family 2 protein [Formivibrio sp.]|nr:glycosyltransferase family 2 protein [Formivibrio sp.]